MQNAMVVCTACVLAVILLHHFVILVPPPLPSSLTINGSFVRFSRTTDGVPDITAQDYEGMARGLGFVHAFDRLTQLDFSRGLCQGRITELYRKSVPEGDAEIIDIAVREASIPRAAKEAARLLSQPNRRHLISAYADGVNHFISDFSGPQSTPHPYLTLGTVLTVYFVCRATTDRDGPPKPQTRAMVGRGHGMCCGIGFLPGCDQSPWWDGEKHRRGLFSERLTLIVTLTLTLTLI